MSFAIVNKSRPDKQSLLFRGCVLIKYTDGLYTLRNPHNTPIADIYYDESRNDFVSSRATNKYRLTITNIRKVFIPYIELMQKDNLNEYPF